MFKKVNIYVKSVIMLEFGYFLNKLRTLLSEVQVKMSIEWKAILLLIPKLENNSLMVYHNVNLFILDEISRAKKVPQ